MAQMKEQKKTPEKELNKMEITNLSDVAIKTPLIQILKELIECGNNIKKTQEEMKVKLSEIKKNIQGISSGVDKAQNQINNMQHMKEKKYSIIISRRKKNPKT